MPRNPSLEFKCGEVFGDLESFIGLRTGEGGRQGGL